MTLPYLSRLLAELAHSSGKLIRLVCPAVATSTLQMVDRPNGVDDAIEFACNQPGTALESLEKRSFTAFLAKETDVVARRYPFAPAQEQWVGMLKESPAGTLLLQQNVPASSHSFGVCSFLWLEGLL